MSTTSRIARTAATFTGVLAVLAGTLVMLGVLAAPAQAAFDPAAKYGYAKIQEPEAYLRHYVDGGEQILHVDTEHMTPDGFYFAIKSEFVNRGFSWRFQPWGAWCGGSAQKVEFNGWMNTHKCGVVWDKMEAEAPGATAKTATCRADTGHPWKFASDNSGTCTNALLHPLTGIFQEDSQGFGCAPWEGITCANVRYAWESAPANSFWAPAPDTCTGLPADANKRPYGVNPDPYVPAGPVPDCTGEAFAPNCDATSTHQGCTGIAPQIVWGTASATAAVTDGTASVTASKNATHKATIFKTTQKAKDTYRGKTYKAKSTVKVYDSATRTVHATATVTDGIATRTSTMSCSAPSQAAANACATDKASAEANSSARAAAVAEAQVRATSQAAQSAAQQATTAAYQAVEGDAVSTSQKKAAVKKAKKQAVKIVKAKIKKAKKSQR